MQKLSVCLTTFNSESTIRPCIESVLWADEIIVLDSCSTDSTRDILAEYPCKVTVQPWLGYIAQKQLSLDMAENDWVFLLDSDEVLSTDLQNSVRQILADEPKAAGYEFPRREQLFWQMIEPGTRHNYFMRLFNRQRGKMNDVPIHSAFDVDGPVERVEAPLFHFSEASISVKVKKLNDWTDEISLSRFQKGKCRSPWALLFYPPFVFLKTFFFKRQFGNGWSGFIGSVCMAFYAFMKDAKGYEHARRAALSDADLMAQTLAADGQPLSKLTPPTASDDNLKSEQDNADQRNAA
jgi:glycosyltransferase involved in cell wall biosynthesis